MNDSSSALGIELVAIKAKLRELELDKDFMTVGPSERMPGRHLDYFPVQSRQKQNGRLGFERVSEGIQG